MPGGMSAHRREIQTVVEADLITGRLACSRSAGWLAASMIRPVPTSPGDLTVRPCLAGRTLAVGRGGGGFGSPRQRTAHR